jgi:allophanate hydrolase subunit 2
VHFAVAGADLGAVLERAGPRRLAAAARRERSRAAGQPLRFTGRRDGCRAYVAFRGGIDVPPVLGSRSTDLASASAGSTAARCARDDRIAVLPASSVRSRSLAAVPQSGSVRVRVVLGPQEHHFAADAVARFLEDAWRVAATSDRIGLRLEGEPLRHRGASEILSDGMVAGSIQVPPDGKPIVMLADGPRPAATRRSRRSSRDLPLLAQLVPGEGEVRFEKVALGP